MKLSKLRFSQAMNANDLCLLTIYDRRRKERWGLLAHLAIGARKHLASLARILRQAGDRLSTITDAAEIDLPRYFSSLIVFAILHKKLQYSIAWIRYSSHKAKATLRTAI